MNYTNLFHVVALVIFYAITGFGPGFIFGLLIGNIFAARDEKTIMQKQYEAVDAADHHNRQWHSSHQRWKK
ncbi:MAG: hypothetical protein ABIH36_03875 [bacterium]